jgi:hypothetical protein
MVCLRNIIVDTLHKGDTEDDDDDDDDNNNNNNNVMHKKIGFVSSRDLTVSSTHTKYFSNHAQTNREEI